MGTKQSSIDWLVSQILVEYDTYLNEEGDLVDKPIKQFFNSYKDFVNLIEYVNKAKEMHRQEIENAWKMGRYDSDEIVMSEKFYAKQYYQETFSEIGGHSEIPTNHSNNGK